MPNSRVCHFRRQTQLPFGSERTHYQTNCQTKLKCEPFWNPHMSARYELVSYMTGYKPRPFSQRHADCHTENDCAPGLPFRLTVCALTFYFSLLVRTVKLPIFDLFEQDSATVRLPRASGQEEAHVVVSPRGCRWVHCDARHLVFRKHVYLHVS